MQRRLLILCVMGLALAACRGGPPRELAGFTLDMTQEQVMSRAQGLGGFTCHLRGTQPRLATCHGPTPEGAVTVSVRNDAVVLVSLLRHPEGRRPDWAMRRSTRRFGEPAWRERPYPTPFDPLEGYHTYWTTRDSSRALAAICAGKRLEPPCTLELTPATPATVNALLDSLLDIRR